MYKKLILIFINSIVLSLIMSCSFIPNNLKNYYNSPSNSWFIEGKISIQYPINNDSKKKDTRIFNFEWAQDQDDFLIKIKIPFHRESILIEKKYDNIELASHKEFLNDIEKKYLWFKLKSEVPFNEMASWIYGKPSLKSNYKILTKGKEIHKSFSQRGWLVEYETLVDFSGKKLPKKIKISNSDYNIKIYIKKWELESSTK